MPKTKHSRNIETIMPVLLVAAGIYYLIIERHHHPCAETFRPWAVFIFLVLMLGIALSKPFANILATGWRRFSELMSSITTPITLGTVFYLLIYPIALLARLFGRKDLLQLKKSSKHSYYVIRNHRFEPKNMQNPW